MRDTWARANFSILDGLTPLLVYMSFDEFSVAVEVLLQSSPTWVVTLKVTIRTSFYVGEGVQMFYQ